MRRAILPLPQYASRLGVQLKRKAQGQLYLYLAAVPASRIVERTDGRTDGHEELHNSHDTSTARETEIFVCS